MDLRKAKKIKKNRREMLEILPLAHILYYWLKFV